MSCDKMTELKKLFDEKAGEDGKLSCGELRRMLREMMKKEEGLKPRDLKEKGQKPKDMFEGWDTDDDGMLSWEEFKEGPLKKIQEKREQCSM